MIKYPTQQELIDLIQRESGTCVSLLMRTHQSGRETNQNPIRFKNLINQAIDRVKDFDENLSERLKSLAELEHDTEFWQHQDAGFALYLCEGVEERLKLSQRPAEVVDIAENFFVRPLAARACRSGMARALAISWERARLFESDGHNTHEVNGETFPVEYHDLVIPRDAEVQLQYSSHSKGHAERGTNVAIYHGHGEGEDKIEADRDAYLSRIGQRISDLMYNTSDPLLLIATDEVAGHFTSTTDVEVNEVIQTSPDGLSDNDLIAKINDAAAGIRCRSDQKLVERLGTAKANDAGSTDISEIVLAAANGRIETLLLGNDDPVHGSFDRQRQRVDLSERGDDLTNLAVRDTLLAGGTVHRLHNDLEVNPVAAIYRY